MSKPRIAFFDFCETIANFQTADSFIDYVRGKRNNQIWMNIFEGVRWVFVKAKIFKILNRLRFVGLHKKFKLYQLKGIKRELLEKYANKYYNIIIKPNLINVIVDELKCHQRDGYEIIIVSGGYSIYLKYFAEEFDVDYVFGTDIGFVGEKCTGKIDGIDCISHNKILKIREAVHLDNYDLKKSFSYSDSKSDFPLFNLVGNKIAVTREYSKPWAAGYKNIIWNN